MDITLVQRTVTRLLLTLVIGATLAAALLIVSATAGARNLSISSQFWRSVYRPLRFVSAGITITSCDVTLEGSFHYRTSNKTLEALVGHITRAAIGACATGSATVLTASLPWHIRYLGFTGVLPDITGVRDETIGVSFRIHERVFGTECLATSTTEQPIIGTARLAEGGGSRTVIGYTADPTARIRCGIIEGGFEGTAAVTEPISGESLTVRLI